MVKTENYIWLRVIITIIILLGLLYVPLPAFSQETLNVQNLIRNGGFEQGFQGEFGVGFEWGGFSNGNAVVGWSSDTWDLVVAEGESAQMIEIKDAAERDRYAGIYQTVPVVPGQQYKLSISGLVRSTEGNPDDSDFGYRLQYAIDQDGSTAWELLNSEAWQELPWDDQPLYDPEDGTYDIQTYDTTITAQSDELTLFIRGWKKWINDGSGIFNLDEISLVGPTPAGFNGEPVAQAVSVSNVSAQSEATEGVGAETTAPTAMEDPAMEDPAMEDPAMEEMTTENGSATNEVTSAPDPATSNEVEATLPVSGYGPDDSVNYVLLVGLGLLGLLLASAIFTTVQWRRHSIE